jgi:hypothetical protein
MLKRRLNKKKRKIALSVEVLKDPAHAVCCEVLNLLSQADPDRDAPRWLRPIALRPQDGGSF